MPHTHNASIQQGDFTDVAKHYHNRPAYSPMLLHKLIACINDNHKPIEQLQVVEVGAGTGKLTALLGELGMQVRAVEPNDAMREIGIETTKHLANITWSKGSGEDVGLASQSADWVIMASSFHWTNPAKSLPEFARVLRGGATKHKHQLDSGGGGGEWLFYSHMES